MHLRILMACPAVGAWLAGQLHRFVVALSDVAEVLEMSRPNPVNWRDLADRMEEVANKVGTPLWSGSRRRVPLDPVHVLGTSYAVYN